MVLHSCDNTELLSIGSIWPKLAVPMVESISTSVANCDSDYRLLHRHMDPLPLHFLPPVKEPFVGPASVRYGPWCPSLVADALEYLQYGSLFTVDSGANRKWISRTGPMVVARGVGCSTGSR